MVDHVQSAVAKLEAERAEAERMFREYQRLAEAEERNVYGRELAINALLAVAGQPPRYPTGGSPADTPTPKPPPGGGGTGGGQRDISIRSDTFYGKRQQTAVREYLEMRKAAGLSAATPREIFEALKEGGYQFEAKDDTTALIGLRALLRKRSQFFHKLPQGAYGLTSWYPDAKKPKGDAAAKSEAELEDDDGAEADDHAAA